MLNVDEALKTIYKNDVFPLCEEMAEKDLTLYFPELDLTIGLDKIVEDSFSMEERLCSDEDITLGACEAAQLKITVADLVQDLSGYRFILTQTINGIYQMPLGSYKVDSCKKQNDLWFREITAYDDMKETDVDVVTWYNSLTWPQTVKSMRESLLTYLGIQFEDQTLNNDDVQLAKTISPSALLGRDVLRRICEINAGFGHITRDGKFKVIQLSGLGLFPSETLLPAEDLFPAESSETMTAGYKQIDYEEYIVESITQLQIKQEDGDVGVTVGDPGNLYVISENFLLYGMTAAELEAIADNILLQIKNKYYRPHNTVCIGLPYIEVGDALTIITSNDAIETFVFQRTLTGIQALQDEYTASGNRKRDNKAGLSTQVEQLKAKTLKIQKSVEGVQMSVTDLDLQLTSEMNFLAGQVELKVDAAGVIAAINLSPETARIKASNIEFEGLVTANSRFKILLDGSMEAVNGKLSGTFETIGPSYSTVIADGKIVSEWAMINILNAPNAFSCGSYIVFNGATGNANILTINGNTPITSGNIGSQSVSYATNAGNAATATTATNAGSASYAASAGSANYAVDSEFSKRLISVDETRGARISANYNYIPDNTGMNIGSSGNPWAGGYGVSGWTTTSDERLKKDIRPLTGDDRWLRFIKMIVPYTFQMLQGTSGRYHTGFVAQQVENAMIECGISDMEFAGLVKAPVYAEKLKDKDGNELDGYDTTSDIVGYTYHLRYEEFIPLYGLWLQSLEVN